jgi:hypothetical protein
MGSAPHCSRLLRAGNQPEIPTMVMLAQRAAEAREASLAAVAKRQLDPRESRELKASPGASTWQGKEGRPWRAQPSAQVEVSKAVTVAPGARTLRA